MPRLGLQHDLVEAFPVVQLHCQQNVAHDLEHGRGLIHGRLALHGQPGRGLRVVDLGRDEVRGIDAAGLAPDALRQLDVVLGLGAQPGQRLAEEIGVGQQILGQHVHVEAQGRDRRCRW